MWKDSFLGGMSIAPVDETVPQPAHDVNAAYAHAKAYFSAVDLAAKCDLGLVSRGHRSTQCKQRACTGHHEHAFPSFVPGGRSEAALECGATRSFAGRAPAFASW